MKTKRTGRIASPVPISLAPKLVEFVNRRWRSLWPKVVSRSHYFQVLVDMDEKKNLIDPKSEPQVLFAEAA